MAEPNSLRLKRKATEDAPNVLVIEGQNRRASKKLRYVRQGGEDEAVKNERSAPTQPNEVFPAQIARRVFHITRKRKSADGERVNEDGLVTIVEKRSRSEERKSADADDEPQFATPAIRPLKRPSRTAAFSRRTQAAATPETEEERKRLAELADYMHDAALDEIKREDNSREAVRCDSPQKPAAKPRISGQQSRERHRQRVKLNGSQNTRASTSPEDERNFVYDTYILANTSDAGEDEVAALSDLGSVGYLVIREEDEEVWEAYLQDHLRDEDSVDGEEDENAEDYYGADYPEDELDSEDELDRNAYAYRAHGRFDDEEWDEHTGEFSDDEDYEPLENPLRSKMPLQFAKYLEDGDHID